MVTTGFSKPYVATYANEGESVTYSGGMSLGRGVSMSLDIDTADENNFYADNEVAETETAQFTSGTVTYTVDGLDPAAAKLIFGLPETINVTVSGKQVAFQGYGNMNPPYVGVGCVRRTMMKGVTQYWPVIMPKIKFGIPSKEDRTQEESIEWQTQELNATVMRDDTPQKNWKYITDEGMNTEEEAYTAVKAFLGDAESKGET